MEEEEPPLKNKQLAITLIVLGFSLGITVFSLTLPFGSFSVLIFLSLFKNYIGHKKVLSMMILTSVLQDLLKGEFGIVYTLMSNLQLNLFDMAYFFLGYYFGTTIFIVVSWIIGSYILSHTSLKKLLNKEGKLL